MVRAGADSRRTRLRCPKLFKATGLRDRGDGQVGSRLAGEHRRPGQARVRSLLRLLLPGARPQPLSAVRLAERKKVPLEGNDGGDRKQHTQDLFEAEALKFVRDHKDKPFFLYLPFTVPHLALQVPDDSLAEYKGKFEETPYRGKAYQHHDTPRAATPR